eukprot:40970-Hanusia_phi.AAC.1
MTVDTRVSQGDKSNARSPPPGSSRRRKGRTRELRTSDSWGLNPSVPVTPPGRQAGSLQARRPLSPAVPRAWAGPCVWHCGPCGLSPALSGSDRPAGSLRVPRGAGTCRAPAAASACSASQPWQSLCWRGPSRRRERPPSRTVRR